MGMKKLKVLIEFYSAGTEPIPQAQIAPSTVVNSGEEAFKVIRDLGAIKIPDGAPTVQVAVTSEESRISNTNHPYSKDITVRDISIHRGRYPASVIGTILLFVEGLKDHIFD